MSPHWGPVVDGVFIPDEPKVCFTCDETYTGAHRAHRETACLLGWIRGPGPGGSREGPQGPREGPQDGLVVCLYACWPESQRSPCACGLVAESTRPLVSAKWACVLKS